MGSHRARRDGRGQWFVVSVILHVAAAVALVYLTPIRRVLLEPLEAPRSASPTMSANQLEELAEAIEMTASETLRQNVETLEVILGEIHRVQTDVGEEFETFDRKRTETAAEDALAEMTTAVEKMNEAVELLEKDAPTEEVDRAQALAEQAQQRAQNKLAQVPFDVNEVKSEQAEAQESHLEAKEAFNEQIRTASAQVTRKVQADRQEAAIARQKENLEALRARPRVNATQVKNSEDRLKQAEQKLAEMKEKLAEVKAKAKEAPAKARQTQREAVKVQKDVLAKLAKTIEKRPKASTQAGAKMAARPKSPQVAGLDAADLYDVAKKTEDKVAEVFKEVRAMDLAMVRDMKLEDAREDIDVVRPQRPELNAKLLREAVRTDARFDAAKGELRKALRETKSMVDLAGRMLEMAQQSVKGMKFGVGAGTEPVAEEESDLHLEIEELAMEDVSGRFADLSEAMMQAQGGQGGEGGGGGGKSKRSIDFEDLTEETPEGGRGLLALGEEGEDIGGMPALTKDVPAVGGRKVTADGVPAEWMYVDTWYTLGPFANPKRRNIDREYPPDSIIDLDASYSGKDGRTIRWDFIQTPGPQVTPANAEEYGIWYAYTELYFDEPCNMIIALGTDDRGILKINGVPVWISSKRLKAWDIDEVWRKVHFNKGVNRLLYRVENGWQNIGFSMVIRLAK